MQQTTTVNIPSQCIAPDSTLKHTIKTFLGQHVQIENIHQQPFINNDGTIPFVVTYLSFPLDITHTYFIPSSEVKQLSPNSTKSITTIDNVYVMINNKLMLQNTKYIPIDIIPIAESVQQNSDLPVPISYYGRVIAEPLHYLIVPIHRSPKQSHRFKFPLPKKLYPENYSPPKDPYTPEQTLENYKFEASSFRILSSADKIILTDSFAKTSPSSIAYVLPFNTIPLDNPLNGVILFITKRNVEYVLYYPTISYTIDLETLQSLKSFFENERINYNNFHYMMSQ